MLYILGMTEDGLQCQVIKREMFENWVKDRTEGVLSAHLPEFVSRIPDEQSASNVYCVIDGNIVVPKPVNVIRYYTLD